MNCYSFFAPIKSQRTIIVLKKEIYKSIFGNTKESSPYQSIINCNQPYKMHFKMHIEGEQDALTTDACFYFYLSWKQAKHAVEYPGIYFLNQWPLLNPISFEQVLWYVGGVLSGKHWVVKNYQ